MFLSRTHYRFAALCILLAGLFWIYTSRIPAATLVQDPLSAPQKGFYAPDFEAVTPEGDVFRLSALKGKPVILNLWASWCPPCREEMPALEKISHEYKTKGVIVIGLNMTAQDSRQAALDFIALNNLTFTNVLDEKGEAGVLYRAQALPSTYFIDSEGIIRDVIVGGPVSEAVFRAQAETLLQGVR
jgi:thiol-disulfide isomerase/thioredoxin